MGTRRCTHSRSWSKSMEDLHDDLLTQIFYRLPCCETAFICKCVCKRWYSLISHPKFGISFLNHNKSSRNLRTWTFFLGSKLGDDPFYVIPTQTQWCISGSIQFGLGFLPRHPIQVAATFKDLVLCYSVISNNKKKRRKQLSEYYICNPLIPKQWVTLPHSPLLERQPTLRRRRWTALICQEPYKDGTPNDKYNFRVVIIDNVLVPKHVQVIAFCSEDWRWIHVNLTMPVRFGAVETSPVYVTQCLVCDGLVYIRSYSMLGAFDPFNITAAHSDSHSIEATTLLLTVYSTSMLVNCKDRLLRASFTLEPYDEVNVAKLDHDPKTRLFSLKWQDLYSCKKFVNKEEYQSIFEGCRFIKVIGIHPTSPSLVYLLATTDYNRWPVESLLVSCNMQTKRFQLLNKFPFHCPHLEAHRLELQRWPTPIPSVIHKSNEPQLRFLHD